MYHIIINPASKSGRGVAIWKELEPIMAKQEVPYRVIYSKREDHIRELVSTLCEKLKDSPDRILNIIVLGGDGTINEALQGITDFSRVRIGYIPTGSSNDLARDLGYPKDPKEILKSILQGEVRRRVDLGVITCLDCSEDGTATDSSAVRRFITSTGIGFDAAVCEEVARSGSKKLLNRLRLGKLTYVAIALKNILGAKSVSCKLILDGQPPITYDRFLFIASMNHRFEGGGFMFAPDAKDNDGILNLCAVGNLPKYKMLMALPLAYKGKHFLFNHIDAYEASSIEIKTTTPLWVHTDGEVICRSSHLQITCEAGAIQLLA